MWQLKVQIYKIGSITFLQIFEGEVNELYSSIILNAVY